MDILLVNPPTIHLGAVYEDLFFIESDNPAIPYYRTLLGSDATLKDGYSTLPGEHLGLQSLQASLEAAGHQVVVINACVELHSTLQQTLDRINEYQANLIGFTGPLDVFAENLWLARSLRESGYSGHITFGHDFATLNHELLLELYPEFDSIVRGEGELTIVALANALEQRQPLDTIQGLSFRRQGRVFVNIPRPVIDDLDALPWVTRYDIPAIRKLKMATAIFTKRGCPYQCSFCTTGTVPLAEGIHGRSRWRQRSAQRVVDEMEFLLREYGVRSFTIVDDLYLSKGTLGSRHALEVAEEILRRQLDITYMIDCRVDSINADVFLVLQRAGLRKVFIGVESASSIALTSFRKGYKPDIIRHKLHILEELGISFILGFIFFNPLDTIEGLEQSYQLLLDLNFADPSLLQTESRIYPGTGLYHDLERRGLLKGSFPFFTTEYQDPYVRRLRTMVNTLDSVARQVASVSPSNGGLNHTLLFRLVSDALGDLIACCKRADDRGLEATFKGIIAEFKQLAH